ncbi:MAG: hypothetical protein L0206_25045 [Actinobacteria bacterium]|nr:hypothetical protein [Actinomycetota bacterium]
MRRGISLSVFALLLASASGAKEPAPTPPPSFDWTGVWAVFDEGIDLVNLAVTSDGTVATTRRSSSATPEAGRWEATDDALFVRYESGRGETILRHASGFRHVSRKEDAESGERTTRIGAAFRITSPTVPFVGAWRLEGANNLAVVVLRSDGTADRMTEPPTTGLWRVVEGRAGIRWQDGAEEAFDPSRPGVRRAAPRVTAKRADDE